MVTVILGAGFSKWAANLPLAKDLFDFDIEPFGPREEKKLIAVENLKELWDQSHPNEPAEAFINFSINQGQELSQLVVWYVVRRLSEPYIWKEWHSGKWRRHVLMIDEYRKEERPGVRKARAFLVGILGFLLRGIITTNYDMLVEYAFGTKRFNYGIAGETVIGRGSYPVSSWPRPISLTGSVSLAKVHGSISWDATTHYTDGRRGLTGNALIVPPIPGKTPPLELVEQWDLAAKLLHGTERIIVFGFAFNQYDSELLKHIQTYSRVVKRVLLIDIKPNVDAAKQIWPTASIETVLPPPVSDSEIHEWLRK